MGKIGDFLLSVGGTIVFGAGTAAADSISVESTGDGIVDASTTIGNFASENPTVNTTIGGALTIIESTDESAIAEGIAGIFIPFRASNSNRLERRAQKIYETLNKNHESNSSQIIVAEDAESAQILEEILNGRTKQEILIALKAFREIATMLNQQNVSKEKLIIRSK